MGILLTDRTDLDWAIGLNRRMLKVIGLWPVNDKGMCDVLLSKVRLIFVATVIFVTTIPALTSLIRVRSDMMLVIDNLQFTMPLLITTVKIFIIWYKKEGI